MKSYSFGINNQTPQQSHKTTQSQGHEWQMLLKIMPSKEGQSQLNQLSDVVFILKDAKTEMWQKRTKQLEQIKIIFLNAVDFIEQDIEIVDHVRQNCPHILTQAQGGPGSQRGSARSASPFNLHVGQGQGGAGTSQASPGYSIGQNSSDKQARAAIIYHVISWMQRIIQPFIILQLTDLRTTVVREACALVLWLCKEFPEEFSTSAVQGTAAQQRSKSVQISGGGNGVKYFQSDAIPKLIASGNKLLQDLGHQTIREILEHRPQIQRVIQHLIPFVNSKNTLMRLRVAQYFEIILQSANKNQKSRARSTQNQLSKEVIVHNSDLFDYFLLKATEDQSQDVRSQARFCFMLYHQLLPESSVMLLLHGITSHQVRKQIAQEFGLDLKQLTQDSQNFERVRQSPVRGDGIQSGQHDAAAAQMSYVDKIKKAKVTFDECNTPEQFLRAQIANHRQEQPVKLHQQLSQTDSSSQAPVKTVDISKGLKQAQASGRAFHAFKQQEKAQPPRAITNSPDGLPLQRSNNKPREKKNRPGVHLADKEAGSNQKSAEKTVGRTSGVGAGHTESKRYDLSMSANSTAQPHRASDLPPCVQLNTNRLNAIKKKYSVEQASQHDSRRAVDSETSSATSKRMSSSLRDTGRASTSISNLRAHKFQPTTERDVKVLSQTTAAKPAPAPMKRGVQHVNLSLMTKEQQATTSSRTPALAAFRHNSSTKALPTPEPNSGETRYSRIFDHMKYNISPQRPRPSKLMGPKTAARLAQGAGQGSQKIVRAGESKTKRATDRSPINAYTDKMMSMSIEQKSGFKTIDDCGPLEKGRYSLENDELRASKHSLDLSMKMKNLSDKKKNYLESTSPLDTIDRSERGSIQQPKEAYDQPVKKKEGIQLYQRQRRTKRGDSDEYGPQDANDESRVSQPTNQFKSIFKVSQKKDVEAESEYTNINMDDLLQPGAGSSSFKLNCQHIPTRFRNGAHFASNTVKVRQEEVKESMMTTQGPDSFDKTFQSTLEPQRNPRASQRKLRKDRMQQKKNQQSRQECVPTPLSSAADCPSPAEAVILDPEELVRTQDMLAESFYEVKNISPVAEASPQTMTLDQTSDWQDKLETASMVSKNTTTTNMTKKARKTRKERKQKEKPAHLLEQDEKRLSIEQKAREKFLRIQSIKSVAAPSQNAHNQQMDHTKELLNQIRSQAPFQNLSMVQQKRAPPEEELSADKGRRVVALERVDEDSPELDEHLIHPPVLVVDVANKGGEIEAASEPERPAADQADSMEISQIKESYIELKPFQSQTRGGKDSGSFTQQASEPNRETGLLYEYRTIEHKRSVVSSSNTHDLLDLKSSTKVKKIEIDEDGDAKSGQGSPQANTARGSIDHVITKLDLPTSMFDICNKVEFDSSQASNVGDEQQNSSPCQIDEEDKPENADHDAVPAFEAAEMGNSQENASQGPFQREFSFTSKPSQDVQEVLREQQTDKKDTEEQPREEEAQPEIEAEAGSKEEKEKGAEEIEESPKQVAEEAVHGSEKEEQREMKNADAVKQETQDQGKCELDLDSAIKWSDFEEQALVTSEPKAANTTKKADEGVSVGQPSSDLKNNTDMVNNDQVAESNESGDFELTTIQQNQPRNSKSLDMQPKVDNMDELNCPSTAEKPQMLSIIPQTQIAQPMIANSSFEMSSKKTLEIEDRSSKEAMPKASTTEQHVPAAGKNSATKQKEGERNNRTLDLGNTAQQADKSDVQQALASKIQTPQFSQTKKVIEYQMLNDENDAASQSADQQRETKTEKIEDLFNDQSNEKDSDKEQRVSELSMTKIEANEDFDGGVEPQPLFDEGEQKESSEKSNQQEIKEAEQEQRPSIMNDQELFWTFLQTDNGTSDSNTQE